MSPADRARHLRRHEEHRYEFSVALNTSATNAYQGDNSVVPFTWDAA